jgi:hypothetical protein
MTEGEMWEKFEDCARRVLSREQIAPLFERLETLETASDVSMIARMMEVRQDTRSKTAAPIRFASSSEQEAPETTWVP